MALNPKKLASYVDKKSKSPFGAKKGGKMPKGGGRKGHDEDEHEHDEDEGDHDEEHEHGEHDDHDEGEGHEHDEGGEHEVDVDEIAERIANGDGDKRLMKLSKGVTEENNPPQWIEDEDIWEKAKEAVEPKWDDYDEPYAVVTHVYKEMGGGIQGE